MYDVELLADVKKDLSGADHATRKRIQKAIRDKLSTNPRGYGEPLSGDLVGLWKLRVGSRRLVFEILDDRVVVLVLGAGKRDAVYAVLTRARLERRRRKHGIQDGD